MYEDVIQFIRETFDTHDFIPLHEPRFIGNEKKYLGECIDTGFVSSVGAFVDRVERHIADYTGARFAVATVNGTAGLHAALLLAGVRPDEEVITQPLTFVATCNAISYCGAVPVFVDVDRNTLGMSPDALRSFLETKTQTGSGICVNRASGKRIRACLPMHTFGHPCRIAEIVEICSEFQIETVEDAAESIGSYLANDHTGTFGKLGVLSFNGNKIITAGGGGCILTNDEDLARKAKHMTTTAKITHAWEYSHDHVGYNYRMPNINAALLLAQLENIDVFLASKRKLATCYEDFFSNKGIKFVKEPENTKSNYWLNSLLLNGAEEKEQFLRQTNEAGIMTRPAWTPMNRLNMYAASHSDSLENTNWLVERLVNIPSSYRVNDSSSEKN